MLLHTSHPSGDILASSWPGASRASLLDRFDGTSKRSGRPLLLAQSQWLRGTGNNRESRQDNAQTGTDKARACLKATARLQSFVRSRAASWAPLIILMLARHSGLALQAVQLRFSHCRECGLGTEIGTGKHERTGSQDPRAAVTWGRKAVAVRSPTLFALFAQSNFPCAGFKSVQVDRLADDCAEGEGGTWPR